MRIDAIMTREVISCRTSDTLGTAAGIMWDHDCGCVPVLDDEGHPVGMLTDRDICMAAYTQGAPLSSLPVASAMSRELFGCAPGDSIDDAERIMQAHQVRRIPVIDAGRRLVGILSLNDLARAASQPKGLRDGISPEAIEATLAAICAVRPHPVA